MIALLVIALGDGQIRPCRNAPVPWQEPQVPAKAGKDLSNVQQAPRRNRCLRASVSINDRSFLPSLVRMTNPLACTVIPKNRYKPSAYPTLNSTCNTTMSSDTT